MLRYYENDLPGGEISQEGKSSLGISKHNNWGHLHKAYFQGEHKYYWGVQMAKMKVGHLHPPEPLHNSGQEQWVVGNCASEKNGGGLSREYS